jgi:16S rRNA (cytidine1402-2'-O)-methyltransferase
MEPKNSKGLGVLYVVATPIGNLRDITLRALETLRSADGILAEDTRVTRKLLSHFDIHKPIEKFERFSEKAKESRVLDRLKQGESLALISDAGTPAILDPGASLVLACHQSGIRVIPIPGPSALISALCVSGLIQEGFVFLGWAPRRAKERRRMTEWIERCPLPTVVFETAKRLPGLLGMLTLRVGARLAFIARELTKLHETLTLRPLRRMAEMFAEPQQEGGLKGELVVVIEGAKQPDSSPFPFGKMEPQAAKGTKAKAKLLTQLLGLEPKTAYRLLQQLKASERGSKL